jgi:serine/threonine protein phosphatase PrpC
MDIGCLTHNGLVRDHNEDAFVVREDLGLFIVADGMGGHEAGEVASLLACQTIERAIELGDRLDDAIKQAHAAIMAHPASDGPRGMGTTVVAVKIEKNGDFLAAWVGDSRIYQVDQHQYDRRLRAISRDHTPVQDLVDGGKITEAQARKHPRRNIINQALGVTIGHYPIVDTVSGHLEPNEIILLCSDGLSGDLDDEAIGAILCTEIQDAIQLQCDALVEAALENGGQDNITVIAIRG